MIGPAGYSCGFYLGPVAIEHGIFISQTFRCLDESKADMNIIYLHALYQLPVYRALVLGNVNAVNRIIRRDLYAELGIFYKTCLPGKNPLVNYYHEHDGNGSRQDKYEYSPDSTPDSPDLTLYFGHRHI
jgi:hypothetical protein